MKLKTLTPQQLAIVAHINTEREKMEEAVRIGEAKIRSIRKEVQKRIATAPDQAHKRKLEQMLVLCDTRLEASRKRLEGAYRLVDAIENDLMGGSTDA